MSANLTSLFNTTVEVCASFRAEGWTAKDGGPPRISNVQIIDEGRLSVGFDAIAPSQRLYDHNSSFNKQTAAAFCGCRKNVIDEAIRNRQLRAKLAGKRYIILHRDLIAWRDSLPNAKPKT
jgi:hypothetical protein